MVQGVLVEDGHIVDTDPSTGKEFARIRVSTDDDISASLAAARLAQPAWACVELAKRIALLKTAVRSLGGDQQASNAALITQEMGKCVSEADTEVAGASNKDELLDLIETARCF